MLTLDTDITKMSRVGQTTAKKLKRLGIETAENLLFYFPFRYDDFSKLSLIKDLKAGESANIVGRIELIQNRRSPRRRMYVTEAFISDESDAMKVIWFNQPFITRNLRVGDYVSLAGKVGDDYGAVMMTSPVYEKIPPLYPPYQGGSRRVHTQGLVPNYHLTADITHKQIRFLIKQVINLAPRIIDWLPFEIRKNLRLLNLGETIKKIHFPQSWKEIEAAKRRLAFNELFLIQLQSQLIHREMKLCVATPIKFFEAETKKFVDGLPFKLTNAQRRAAWEILKDLGKNKPMARLLEGDVGSGKTVVAVIAMLNVALNSKQAVLMAPTEILAAQHFNSICQLFKDFNVRVGLVTSSQARTNADLYADLRGQWVGNASTKEDKISKNKILEMIKSGELDIIIGTHSLIQENVNFKNLVLAVVDEQHRFGVEQRAKLATRTDADIERTDADTGQTNVDKLLYEDLTYKIRGAVYKVKKELGLGHKEIVYQNALKEEFSNLGLKFEKEKTISVRYNNKKVGIYKPDFLIEGKIIIEIKKLPFIGKIERKQVLHYLLSTDYLLALLINFGNNDVQVERIIDTNKKSAQVRLSPRKSAYMPHLLSMTATPIPRSLALALYGDLDISIINEMPVGRKKVFTKVVSEENREKAYNFIREEIKKGRQVFVVCPLIDLSDKLGVKSVKAEFEKLDKQVFSEIKMGMLHGRMKARAKEEIMKDFLDNKIKILVSTSVVEVGVDVPNASIMMIEGADRFGLAQLHQFRGRVGRSEHQSYCFLFTPHHLTAIPTASKMLQSNGAGFTESSNDKILKRLNAVVNCYDGFALAKMDLKFRGPGEVYGTLQKGFPELKIASLFDYELMKLAKEEAEKLIKKDAGLLSSPALEEKLALLNFSNYLTG